jgi:enoyl-CoA hydratase
MSEAAAAFLTVDDSVATVILNRPRQHNAINGAMRAAFGSALETAAADDSVKVVVVRGAGDRAFSSGADLKEIGTRTPMQRRLVSLEEPSAIVRAFDKPVIAAMRGYVFGGGLELAGACDIRLASDNAVFCFPEIAHGWFPSGGGTQFMPRLVGMGRAMELILTGRRFTANEAMEMGLLNAVYPDAGFDAAVQEMASTIAKHNLGALILAKAAMRMSERAGADVSYIYEKELGALSYTLEGREEALSKFAARSSRSADKRESG